MVIRINTPVLLIGFLKNLKIKMNALFCLFFPERRVSCQGFSLLPPFSPLISMMLVKVRAGMADIFRSILVTLIRKTNPRLQAQRYLLKCFSLMLGDNNIQELFSTFHAFFLSFSGSSAGKESTCNAGDPASIPGSGRSPGKGIGYPLQYSWAFLMVKNLPAVWETWVRSLGWEDHLEEGMAIHSSIFTWRIP